MLAPSHPTGRFSRLGIRYEVALDVLGSLIAHFAARPPSPPPPCHA